MMSIVLLIMRSLFCGFADEYIFASDWNYAFNRNGYFKISLVSPNSTFC